MLTILHVLNEYRSREKPGNPISTQIDRDKLKVIYV